MGMGKDVKTVLARPAKKMLGAKRGFGAQRIATDFKSIEQDAQSIQTLKEKTAVVQPLQPEKEDKEEESKKMTSMRLAYQDLGLQQKKAENKLRQMDPQKAEQMERLGMGFSNQEQAGIAHSATSDMTIIQQNLPPSRKAKHFPLDDEFELLGFPMGPPKYNDSPFSSNYDDNFSSSKTSSLPTTFPPGPAKPKRSFIDKESSPKPKSSASYSKPDTGTEAQQLFGNAKSISSSQFFGNDKDAEMERKSNLNKFQSSSSISSSEYFGRPQPPESNVPNLYDIKEGVKGGVTKVAGRLSTMASGVINSIQDKYGY